MAELIAVLGGEQRKEVAAKIQRLLPQALLWEAEPGAALPTKMVTILVITPDLAPAPEQQIKAFLRLLPYHRGLVVAYGRSGLVRKASRGFQYRFRWYDEKNIWPGLLKNTGDAYRALVLTAVARVAHEVGLTQEQIKKGLNTS